MNYLNKYKIQYFNPHFDVQTNLNILQITLNPLTNNNTNKKTTLFIPLQLNTNLTNYDQIRNLHSTNTFLQTNKQLNVLNTITLKYDNNKSIETNNPNITNLIHIQNQYNPYFHIKTMF